MFVCVKCELKWFYISLIKKLQFESIYFSVFWNILYIQTDIELLYDVHTTDKTTVGLTVINIWLFLNISSNYEIFASDLNCKKTFFYKYKKCSLQKFNVLEFSFRRASNIKNEKLVYRFKLCCSSIRFCPICDYLRVSVAKSM